MTTVIDELVLQLKLDPSTWAPGERKALQSLRDLETAAQRSGRRVEQSGAQVVSFFHFVEAPIAGLRQKFEALAQVTVKPQQNLANLATEARRAGTNVEAGALTATAGVRALGVAGLAALVTIGALGKAMEFAAKTSQKVFGAGVGAATAGVNITQFTAASQALSTHGNVPQEQTQNWLARYQSARQRALMGDYSEANALNLSLAQAGAGFNIYSEANPIHALERLAQVFSGQSEERVSASGLSLGMDPVLAQALRSNGGKLPGLIQGEEYRATTGPQGANAKKLLDAQNDLARSWDNLARKLNEDLDPALATFDTWLARIIDRLTPHDVENVASDLASAVIPGAGLVMRAWNWLRDNKLGGAQAPAGDAPGAGKTSYSPASGTDVDTVRQAVAASGGNEQTQAAFLAMFNPESGLDPSSVEKRPGFGYGPGVGGKGGASYAQWTGSRRRELESFGWTGLNPAQDRIAAAKMLQWELTTKPEFRAMVQQMNAAPGATAAAKIGGFTYEQGGPGDVGRFGQGSETQGTLDRFHSRQAEQFYKDIHGSGDLPRSLFPPGLVKYNSKGEPYSASLDKMTDEEKARVAVSTKAGFPAHVPDWLAAIEPGSSTVSSDNSQQTTVNVGSINVHTPTANPLAHGGAVASALNRMTTQANSGLN